MKLHILIQSLTYSKSFHYVLSYSEKLTLSPAKSDLFFKCKDMAESWAKRNNITITNGTTFSNYKCYGELRA